MSKAQLSFISAVTGLKCYDLPAAASYQTIYISRWCLSKNDYLTFDYPCKKMFPQIMFYYLNFGRDALHEIAVFAEAPMICKMIAARLILFEGYAEHEPSQ